MTSEGMWSGSSASGSRRSRASERRGPRWRSASRRCVHPHPPGSSSGPSRWCPSGGASQRILGDEGGVSAASCLRLDNRARGLAQRLGVLLVLRGFGDPARKGPLHTEYLLPEKRPSQHLQFYWLLRKGFLTQSHLDQGFRPAFPGSALGWLPLLTRSSPLPRTER